MGNLNSRDDLDVLSNTSITGISITLPEFITVDYEGYFCSDGIIRFDLLNQNKTKIILIGYFKEKYYHLNRISAIKLNNKDIDPMSLKGKTIQKVELVVTGPRFLKRKSYLVTMNNGMTYQMHLHRIRIRDETKKFRQSPMRPMKIINSKNPICV